MSNQWIFLPFSIISILALLAALYFLVRRNWITPWLRGNTGIFLLAIAIFTGITALNVRSYHTVYDEMNIAVVHFKEIGHQRYQATVATTFDARERSFEMTGDLWQIDARIIKWRGPLAFFGKKPSFKLDRLQGRYITLEDERSKPRSVYSLGEEDIVMNLWSTTNHLSEYLSWFDAEYGSATYLPMADGAFFNVQLTSNGLIARPDNSEALKAIKDWE